MAKCHTKKLYGDLFAVQMWAGQGARYGKSICSYHIRVGISLDSWQRRKCINLSLNLHFFNFYFLIKMSRLRLEPRTTNHVRLFSSFMQSLCY